MEVTKYGRMTVLTFNKPLKKNALSLEMLVSFINCLEACAVDPECGVTVITGSGEYFTSGNDLSNFMNADLSSILEVVGGTTTEVPSDIAGILRAGRDFFCKFVKTLIDYPKLLVAIVNGPAVGVGVTMLPLCDLVYMSSTATLSLPFTELGQVPEACSSYTFPLTMGTARASCLLTGGKLTAEVALAYGLVTRVYKADTAALEIWRELQQLTVSTPLATIARAKQLMRSHNKDILHQVNERECDALLECWSSEEFANTIASFFRRKSKL